MKELKIESKTVVKCESCGGYHAEEDSEYITIKIIKGKKCPLPKQNIFENNGRIVKETEVVSPTIFEKEKVITNRPIKETSNEVVKGYDPNDPNVVKLVTSEGKKEYLRENKTIPPEFLRMMVPPSDPNFETKGMKVTRRIP
jgi:hypothetical protein